MSHQSGTLSTAYNGGLSLSFSVKHSCGMNNFAHHTPGSSAPVRTQDFLYESDFQDYTHVVDPDVYQHMLPAEQPGNGLHHAHQPPQLRSSPPPEEPETPQHAPALSTTMASQSVVPERLPTAVTDSAKRGPHTSLPVVMAIADSTLTPEVATIVAATGRDIIDTMDPREITRHATRARAVVVDETTAAVLTELPSSVLKIVVFPDPGPANWELAMKVRADGVFVIPAQAPELLSLVGRTDSGLGNHQGDYESGEVVAVIGAAGGVGASSLAAALTLEVPDATLIDAVANSGGLDLLLGVEESQGVRFNDVVLSNGHVAAHDLKNALPHVRSGQAVLTTARHGMDLLDASEVGLAINSLRSTGSVFVDCPAEGALSDEVLDHCDRVLLVVPSEIRAVARASALMERFAAQRVPVDVVLRHRGWSGLSVKDVESMLGTGVTAELPHVRKLPKQAELHGLGRGVPSALQKVASSLATMGVS